jgi:phenylpropionate dioxygenase-like ring-hydroxylating dioxygenase large terminal subunit
MFVHQGALEPALEPSDYANPEILERERNTVFAHGWHLVACSDQLAREGSFVSTEIAGLPVLVRREQGALHAFVNVCAHRHSLLESPGCGVRDRLRCRYHGWEYDVEGSLRKLPDGRSFKGVKASNLQLRKLRVERFGPLVYVAPDERDPPLREWMGALADELAPFYERPLRMVFSRTSEHDVNWKVIVENAVESYHVPMVHPETFRYYRDPALHDHRLEPNFTRYSDLEPWSTSWMGRALQLFAKLAIPNSDGKRFRHAHAFPNQLYYFGDLFCDVAVVTPLGPKRSRHTSFGFVADQLLLSPLTAPLQRIFGTLVSKQGARIFGEDGSAWSAVQKGLEHPNGRGVLSAREERVWAFQRWVAAQLGRTKPQLLSAEPSRTKPR